jgi:hypothetical protein
MIEFLLNVEQIDQVFWARPISSGGMVFAFVAALAIGIYSYRRRQGVPNWVRTAAFFSRILTLGLVLTVLFEPTAKVTETQTSMKRLPVLIDVSESMSVKDQRKRSEDIGEAAQALGMLPLDLPKDELARTAMSINATQRQTITASSRLDLAKALISKSAHDVLAEIGREVDVQYYSFGEDLTRLGGAGEFINNLEPLDSATSIAHALETVANTDRGTPLAGVILVSDGLDTSSQPIEATVRNLGIQGIPVYTVPIGIADPDDVIIRNDKVPVRVQIQSKGYEKRMADLTVSLNGRSVARQSVTFQGGMQFEEIYFNVDVGRKGSALVEVTIEPFADEATEDNNTVERSVRIVNEKVNVLCIEGSARWEFRYLRAMLKRDPRINATFIATRADAELAASSSEYIAAFPEDRDEAFSYDLVILGDVNSSFFSIEALQRLEELVRERGGSLLMLCGARYAPSSYAGTPVERMLPVVFDPDAEWEDLDESVYPVLTPEGRSSLVMTLENKKEENDLIWSRVAPMDRIPPLLTVRPGATVLAELSDSLTRQERYPLVSWQRYGTGKCMAIATDRLWLLRFKTGDKYHWRVWSQCIQFLTLSRLMGEHKRIRIETDRATYPVGNQVMLYAHLLNEEYDPVTQAGFDVEVSAVDAEEEDITSQRVTLRPDATNPGLYEGYFSPPLAGRYRVEAAGEDKPLSNTNEFQVADINPELTNTEMQGAYLDRIAQLSGGQTLGIQGIGKLAELVARTPHTTTIRTEVPLWDNGWVAFLICGLLGFEWILRRKYDLP